MPVHICSIYSTSCPIISLLRCEQIGHFEEENTIDSSLHNANIRPNPNTQSRLIQIENSGILGDKCETRHTLGLLIGQHTRHGGGKENVQVCITSYPLFCFIYVVLSKTLIVKLFLLHNLNSIRGNNHSSKSQIGKKLVNMISETKNTRMLADQGLIQNMNVPQVHKFINQVS